YVSVLRRLGLKVKELFRSRFLLVLVCSAALAPSLAAQKDERQPLTQAQVDQIREEGIYPDERIRLYTKFIGEHVDTIKSLSSRGHSSARAHRLDDVLQDLTALMDELGSNLDQYGDRKADLRKSLKTLNEVAPRWLEALNGIASERTFELSRKEAIDSGKDLSDQVSQLFKEQTDYFDIHKDQRGQDRAEPQ
ncbi:MAG: hypothetical protein WBF42_12140, partial [Terracidiphilus sp.]